MPGALQVAAASSVAVTTALILVMDWVPTGLNRNIAGMDVRERIPGSVVHAVTGLAFVTANLLAWWWAAALAGVWYTVVLVQAVRNWWVPYLVGSPYAEVTPEDFRTHYAANPSVLPPVRDHVVVPDVQHLLIHTAVLVTAVLSWLSAATA
ncbi:hypothetical protein [Phycicoccus flavus]|uniref:hypothetical protein n=1 Tax=Phycicoccus flavus TaxID=2502783 RepID=UPI000FEB9AFB|nr:hypothetical protein [Phycicoccus flavus]NHA66858.1 hypothetical protein [Phycicoccus flavus]